MCKHGRARIIKSAHNKQKDRYPAKALLCMGIGLFFLYLHLSVGFTKLIELKMTFSFCVGNYQFYLLLLNNFFQLDDNFFHVVKSATTLLSFNVWLFKAIMLRVVFTQ